MPTDLWVITGICVWIGSLLFSALGLFIGYLLPSENVTADHLARPDGVQHSRAGCSFPVSHFSPHLATLAKFTPLYGLNELVHYPLVGSHFKWYWVLNLAGWLGVFVLGAVWQLRRDTARV